VSNEFPWEWHEAFSRDVPAEWTEAEVAFLARQLPPGRVLDVACGFGRHAVGLGALGWDVLGVERDPRVATETRAAGVEVVELDVRELDRVAGSFDGVISMWASFGWFDDAGNEAVLAAMTRKLRPGGVLVLDVWNPPAHRSGERVIRAGVRERKTVTGGRLRTALDYGDGALDVHDFRLYEPAELEALGARHGLERVALCTWCDESRRPTTTRATSSRSTSSRPRASRGSSCRPCGPEVTGGSSTSPPSPDGCRCR